MKSKNVQLKAEIQNFNLQKAIILLINGNQSKEIVMLLILLKEGLVDLLEILLDNFSIILKLNDDSNESVCSFLSMDKKAFKGSISINSLEFAIFYLLKYYRDDFAEVEHIDLDFKFNNGSIVTLIIKVNEHKEISLDEMNKLLEL